jgi:hypothetical protein
VAVAGVLFNAWGCITDHLDFSSFVELWAGACFLCVGETFGGIM